MPLPLDATPRSHTLFELAREIIDLCPSELGTEIALTGSVARGWSDDLSDIEIALWVDKLDWPGEREAWLLSIGAERIIIDKEAHASGSWWTEFVYKGTWVECGWQEITPCNDLLKRILAGEVEDMFAVALAEALHHAIPMREGPQLRQWQATLQTYPEAFRRNRIELATRDWSNRHWFELYELRMERPDPAIVLLRHEATLRNILRLLHAINGSFEPDLRKWVPQWADTLAHKPDNLAQRVLGIFTLPLARESYRELLALMEETLNLIPKEYDVSAARANVAEARR